MSRRLPRFGTVIEVALAGRVYRAPLEDADDGRLSLTLPADPQLRALSAADAPAGVRWSAGTLGTAMTAGRLSYDGDSCRLTIDLVGPVVLKQDRRFVRGGGGERIELRREVESDTGLYTGWVTDLSEASLRARFPELPTEPGESVSIAIDLDDTRISALGLVRTVTSADQTSVVIGYRLDERRASTVRRYLLRQETMERSRRRH